MTLQRKVFLAFAIMGAASLPFNVQALELTSGNPTLSENFNSMGAGSAENVVLPEGWRIDRNLKGPRQVGSWDEASNSVMYYLSENLASNQSNGTYGFFASEDNTDRAIGGLTTSVDNGTRGVNLITKITNTDPSLIITNINLDYNIEKYRYGSNAAGFSVRIFTSNDGVRWTEATDLITSFNPDNETIGTAPVPISTTEITNAPLRVHVLPGNDIYLAWNISVTSGTACASAPGYAIDDINVTATFAPTDDDWVEEELPDFIPSGIYIRGEINGWTADQEWEFSKLSDTEFALYNKTLSGSFKVADASWSSSCNYGSNGDNITMDVAYVLNGGSDPANISTGGLSFPCSEILLTIEDGKASLKLIPNVSTKGLTAVYMVGDFNNWNYMGTTGKLSLDSTDNLFKGQIGLTAGEDGLSHWMIYQRLAMAGAWGLDQTAVSASSEGILSAGAKGHVVSEPGMYDVTFNLATGEYTLSQMSSTAMELILSPANTTLVPTLPEKVKVLSLNNSLIHYNDQAKVFNDIATSMNKDAYWTKHTNLGKTLQYHWEEGDGMTEAGEPGAKMVIRSDSWSHIILQEQTALPRTDFTSFSNSVKQWVEYIHENCPNPNAVIILPLNWALGQDWSNFTDYNKILLENYTKVAQEYGVVICPVGLAYQAKFEKDGGDATEKSWFLPGDDRHPTLKATYLAALMEYGIIFNEDPASVSYYPSYTTEYDAVGEINDAIAAEMRNYASNALKAYQNVVNHHASTVNLKASVLDQFGMEMPDQAITWTVEPATASIDGGTFSATVNGIYTITATSVTLSASAVVTVADPETEVPNIDYITFSNDNLEYFQDFDSMGDAEEANIPEGWRADGQLTERTLGTYLAAAQTTLKAGGANFGSTAKNGVWNLGNSFDATDRALGGVTTDAAGGAKSINIYAALKNNGSKHISTLDLSYDVEKYRDGANAAGFTVQLYTSVDGRNWKSAGNTFKTDFEPSSATAGSSDVPMETRHETGTIEFDMAPGAELFLAWNISATSGTSCQAAPILSIDNVEILAGLRPVPTFDYHIYIENQSGYEKTGLYAWGDGEIFGTWPGQNPIDLVEINGVTYEVFGHNQASGQYNLIYNNNNNGAQYNDLAVEGGQDYYLRANSNGKTLEILSSAIDSIIDENNSASITISGDSIICEEALTLTVFNMAGVISAQSNSNSLNVASLAPGIYIVNVTTVNGNLAKKFLKK